MITDENKKLFIFRHAFVTSVLIIISVVLNLAASLDMSMLAFIGPFLTTLYAVEHMEQKYCIASKAWLKQPLFYMSVFSLQLVVAMGVMTINGEGYGTLVSVTILQSVFSISAVFVSAMYARIRASKDNK